MHNKVVFFTYTSYGIIYHIAICEIIWFSYYFEPII